MNTVADADEDAGADADMDVDRDGDRDGDVNGDYCAGAGSDAVMVCRLHSCCTLRPLSS